MARAGEGPDSALIGADPAASPRREAGQELVDAAASLVAARSAAEVAEALVAHTARFGLERARVGWLANERFAAVAWQADGTRGREVLEALPDWAEPLRTAAPVWRTAEGGLGSVAYPLLGPYGAAGALEVAWATTPAPPELLAIERLAAMGGPALTRALADDVERARTEALAEKEQLLHAVFESSAAGLAILVGEELRYVRVNPAYRALTPDPKVDPVGRRFEEVWPIPRAVEGVRRVLRTGQSAHQENFPVPLDGARTRFFSFHVERVWYRAGEAILAVVWETTALEDARQDAEVAADIAVRHASQLDAVLDAIADGFVLYGPRGEILRLNEAAKRLLQLEAADPRAYEERLGAVRMTTPDGRPVPAQEAPVARALAGEIVRGAHLRMDRPDAGVGFWMIASAAPIRAPDGEILGAVLTFSDESAIHKLEEERDDLVRMISHDLRTPLNAVYTQAHLIRRHPQDAARVAERARSIVLSCERMSAMIHDLVEATLLEAGQLRIAPCDVDLAPLVSELLDRLRGGLDVDRLRIHIPSGLPPLRADPPRLERILVNLLSNALKYSSAESEVTLEAAPAADGVVIAVSDRGIGIAPEDLPHLFERFFRARGLRRPEGLGLGLYITRLLVEAHGGSIDVESRLGKGSTFRLRLPCRRAPLQAPAPGA